MKINWSIFVLFAIIFVFVASIATAEHRMPHTLTSKDQENHTNLVKQMSSDQIKVLSRTYPNFRILKLCSGRFSDGDRDELVLGIWIPLKSKESGKREVLRIGMIWNQDRWEAHLIDDEIKKDDKISNSFPMEWQYTFNDKGFSGDMKCGIESEFRDNSDLSYSLGDKPFFDLNEEGLRNSKPVCFATSDVYNNWDCVVYSPKDKRFRLWFQQAHAD